MRRMLDDIDRKFDTILTNPPPGVTDLTPQELEEAQRLFLEIAANYLSPVRDLMVEVDMGEPTKDWLAVCRPAVNSLRASVSSFLADALGADFLKVFLAIKQQECARFSAEVTELDYAWYLRS